MTAFGLSICLIVKARKGLKSLPTMLEESNETIFQMKDAMYFSFKELQLNMDYIFCIAIRSNIKTLTLYSDPNHNHNPNPNHNQTLTITKNLTFSLKWPCHVMSRDRRSFLAITGQGSILTLRERHVG